MKWLQKYSLCNQQCRSMNEHLNILFPSVCSKTTHVSKKQIYNAFLEKRISEVVV